MKIETIIVKGDHDKSYGISVNADGAVTCTCPSYKYRTRCCKHISYLLDHINDKDILS